MRLLSGIKKMSFDYGHGLQIHYRFSVIKRLDFVCVHERDPRASEGHLLCGHGLQIHAIGYKVSLISIEITPPLLFSSPV